MKYLKLLRLTVLASACAVTFPSLAGTKLTLKAPGAKAQEINLVADANGRMKAADGRALPLEITREAIAGNGVTDIRYTVKATEPCYFNLAEDWILDGTRHDACEFYMPGFWYHHNLRSPKEAPSFHTSDTWRVREDRLSSPLTGVYDPATAKGYTVLRTDKDRADAMEQNQSGDIILSGHSSVGFTGFENRDGKSSLTFGYPYVEAPRRYIRKLQLIDPVRAFERMAPGDVRQLSWQTRTFDAKDYSDFVGDIWNYTFDTLSPAPVAGVLSTDEAKACLANYFRQSYVGNHPVKYFSSAAMPVADCRNMGELHVGFIGRHLLNAFNALEYGNERNDKELTDKGLSILTSTLENGMTPEGYFMECCNFDNGYADDFLSIRRQSEAVFALMQYLDYERRRGNKHPEWDSAIRKVLDNMIALQNPDGSFPRKFKGLNQVVDASGGSSPCAIIPFAMAYKYFGDKRYLEAAKKTAVYLENELIDKADYFSSTLDANCEDKEAAIYASTALYYLTRVTKGKERAHYMDQCRRAAYFALSWYYMWDVPFSPGQMLGDVDFRSRGWGNVSVENNHIDVYIFEFNTVLEALAKEYADSRFSDFAQVIKTSMLQLMPTADNTFTIGKAGFYPEVVQHTTWDYGRNGKGFFNDIFAPGWTVASLWQMLSPDRLDHFFAKK